MSGSSLPRRNSLIVLKLIAASLSLQLRQNVAISEVIFGEVPACGANIASIMHREKRFNGNEEERVRSGEFRSIEVATLEKRQRHFKNPRLASLEFKFLPTLRCRASPGTGVFVAPILRESVCQIGRNAGWYCQDRGIDYG